jgi:hypothetical protein
MRERTRSKGPRTLGTITTGIVTFFGDAVIASVCGMAVGVSMLALTRMGVRSFTPETLEVGMARAVVLMVLGLVIAFVGLLLYFVFVRAGLVPFGLGLVVGFTVPALVALFRMSGIAKSSTARR